MLVAVEAGKAPIIAHGNLIALLFLENPAFILDAVHEDVAHGHQPGAGICCERLPL